MNLSRKGWLPMVLLTVFGIGAPAMVASAEPGPTPPQRLPAAFRFQERSARTTPAKLQDYTFRLATRVGAENPQRMTDRCETVSGSYDGWDDSRLDC